MLVSGSIGVTILKKECFGDKVCSEKIVIILSDSHAVTNYCSVISDKNISLTEFLLKNKKNKQILIEEIPNDVREKIQLQDIWYNVPHIKELKNYVLKNSKNSEGIDIRFELLPISIDLIYNNDFRVKNMKSNELFLESKYFNELDNFFNGNGQVYNKYFSKILKNNKADKKPMFISSSDNKTILNEYINLSKDYSNIKNNFSNFRKLNNCNSDISIIEMFNKDRKFAEECYFSIDKLLNNIMEFYVVIRIIMNEDISISTSILHMGLYHSSNVKNKLLGNHNFNIIYENGITKFPPIVEDNIISCIRLPNLSEFGID